MAMILACAARAHYAGGAGVADAPRASRAIYETSSRRRRGRRTPDLGGHASTSAFTSDVVERVRTKIDVWSSLGTAV